MNPRLFDLVAEVFYKSVLIMRAFGFKKAVLLFGELTMEPVADTLVI